MPVGCRSRGCHISREGRHRTGARPTRRRAAAPTRLAPAAWPAPGVRCARARSQTSSESDEPVVFQWARCVGKARQLSKEKSSKDPSNTPSKGAGPRGPRTPAWRWRPRGPGMTLVRRIDEGDFVGGATTGFLRRAARSRCADWQPGGMPARLGPRWPRGGPTGSPYCLIDRQGFRSSDGRSGIGPRADLRSWLPGQLLLVIPGHGGAGRDQMVVSGRGLWGRAREYARHWEQMAEGGRPGR